MNVKLFLLPKQRGDEKQLKSDEVCLMLAN